MGSSSERDPESFFSVGDSEKEAVPWPFKGYTEGRVFLVMFQVSLLDFG